MLAQYSVRVAPKGNDAAATSTQPLTAPEAWATFQTWVAYAKADVVSGIVTTTRLRVELRLVLPAGDRVIYATDARGEPTLLTARLDDLYDAVCAAEKKAAEFDALLTALTAEED